MMNNKEVISRVELLELIKNEAKKFDLCEGIYIGPVKAQILDELGSNWVLKIDFGDLPNYEKCFDVINQICKPLRHKYNIEI